MNKIAVHLLLFLIFSLPLAAQQAYVEADFAKVVFIGIPSRICVSYTGIKEKDVILKTFNATLVKLEKNCYNRLGSRRNKAGIYFCMQKGQDTVIFDSLIYHNISVSKPKTALNVVPEYDDSYKKLTVDQIRGVDFVYGKLDKLTRIYGLGYVVTKMVLTIAPIEGDVVSIPILGDSVDLRPYASQLRNGDKIIFDNILAKGPDQIRPLAPLGFEVYDRQLPGLGRTYRKYDEVTGWYRYKNRLYPEHSNYSEYENLNWAKNYFVDSFLTSRVKDSIWSYFAINSWTLDTTLVRKEFYKQGQLISTREYVYDSDQSIEYIESRRINDSVCHLSLYTKSRQLKAEGNVINGKTSEVYKLGMVGGYGPRYSVSHDLTDSFFIRIDDISYGEWAVYDTAGYLLSRWNFDIRENHSGSTQVCADKDCLDFSRKSFISYVSLATKVIGYNREGDIIRRYDISGGSGR